jgi:hypothetical protein
MIFITYFFHLGTCSQAVTTHLHVFHRFKAGDIGLPVCLQSSVGQYKGAEANQLIEEFMLLANMRVAQLIAGGLPDRALLRCDMALLYVYDLEIVCLASDQWV